MCGQMGKIVTVFQKYKKVVNGREVTWKSLECVPWSGWIVGFTYKMDGKLIYGNWEEPTIFKATKRKLCVLVKPWPTMKHVFVPMDGFKLGGEPEPPNYGGWKNLSKDVKESCIEQLRKDAKRQPRDERGRWIKKVMR